MINLRQKRSEMSASSEYGVIVGGPLFLLDDGDLNKHQTGKISDKSLIVYCYVANMARLNMDLDKKSVAAVMGWPEGSVVRCLNQLEAAGLLTENFSSKLPR